MERFTNEKEYLEGLAEGVEVVSDNNRASFCRKHGISESALSYFLNGKRRMSRVEQKILLALDFKKQVKTEIILTDLEPKRY